jgi:hypothetical protein
MLRSSPPSRRNINVHEERTHLSQRVTLRRRLHIHYGGVIDQSRCDRSVCRQTGECHYAKADDQRPRSSYFAKRHEVSSL